MKQTSNNNKTYFILQGAQKTGQDKIYKSSLFPELSTFRKLFNNNIVSS